MTGMNADRPTHMARPPSSLRANRQDLTLKAKPLPDFQSRGNLLSCNRLRSRVWAAPRAAAGKPTPPARS
jgi:hypothetical protein